MIYWITNIITAYKNLIIMVLFIILYLHCFFFSYITTLQAEKLKQVQLKVRRRQTAEREREAVETRGSLATERVDRLQRETAVESMALPYCFRLIS